MSGAITLTGNATIGSDNGSLSIAGSTITTGDDVYQLAFTGGGATNVSDPIAPLQDPSPTTPALLKNGSGTLTFTSQLNLTGSATLQANAGGVTVNAVDLHSFNFTVAGSTSVTLAGIISDASVAQTGTLTVAMSGVNAAIVQGGATGNTYAAGTWINSGVLDLQPNYQNPGGTGNLYHGTLAPGTYTSPAPAASRSGLPMPRSSPTTSSSMVPEPAPERPITVPPWTRTAATAW